MAGSRRSRRAPTRRRASTRRSGRPPRAAAPAPAAPRPAATPPRPASPAGRGRAHRAAVWALVLGDRRARRCCVLSLGTLFIVTLPLLDRRAGCSARARGGRGGERAGRGQATAALWLGRIGVIAGVAAVVVSSRSSPPASTSSSSATTSSASSSASARTTRRRRGDGVRASRACEQSGSRPAAAGSLRSRLRSRPPSRDAESVHQAVPHDRRPDAGAAGGLAGDGRADALPPRARLRRALRARARRACRTSSAPSNPVLAFAASGSGAMESAVANLVRPGHEGARAAPRASSASAGSSSARPTAPSSSATSRAGACASTRPRSTACSSEHPGVEVVFATLSETSTGIVHDVQAIAEVVRRHGALLVVDAVSGLGAARLRAGRVGRRRRRRRLAEGADDAARPGLRLGLRARARAPRTRDRRGRYYFDWAAPPRARRKGASPFTPAVSLFLGLDVALGMIEEEGLENVWARHDLLARATRAGVARARPRALRRPRRALHRRHGDRAARRRRRRQGPRHAAQARHHRERRPGRTSRAASCGSRTAATSARSTSSRRSPASRSRWHSSATTSSTAPASAPRSASSSRPACSRAA